MAGRPKFRTAGVPPASNGTSGWRSRGYLPHVDAPGLVQHIVFRLADSLPSKVHQELRNRPPDEQSRAVDAALDEGYGARYLADSRIAALVQDALLAFDAERYRLLAWCVMPSHIHSLVELQDGSALDRVLHSWKSYTAKQANALLGRSGAFWAPEYFDRFMRDDEHLVRTAAYIEANPVKAGLCESISDWRFSSAWHRWGGRDARGPNNRPASN